jgi:hypothetical protein
MPQQSLQQGPIPPFGVITVDGHQYIERVQIFTSQITIEGPGQGQGQTGNLSVTNIPVTMPGVAPFLLKGLTRDVIGLGEIINNQTINASIDKRFRFNLRNSQGSTWFFTSGLWIFDDRVIDTMCFGTGQFPFPLIPPIPIPANGTIFYDVEDLNLPHDELDSGIYPYTIHFGFHGSFLFPIN